MAAEVAAVPSVDEIHFHLDKKAPQNESREVLVQVLNAQSPAIRWSIAGEKDDILTGYTQSTITSEWVKTATLQWDAIGETGFRIYIFVSKTGWKAGLVNPPAGVKDVKFSEFDQLDIQETVKDLQTQRGR